MNEALAAEQDAAVYEQHFIQEMLRQMRAIDTYDSYDNWSNAQILDPFVMTKERKAAIPVVGDPDEIVMARVKAYYNGLATSIEKQCGLMAVPMINLSHEGFGRAIICVGKLIVVDKTLRDVHRFGFKSLQRMNDDAEKVISRAVDIIEKYPEAARD